MSKVFLPKNKPHKSNMLANQFTLSSSCLNYPPRFVNVTLPIQMRLLRNAMSQTTPIDPALNQAFSINELLSAINDTKNTTPGPDNICYEMFKHMSIKSLEVMLQLFKTKSDSSAKFLHPGYTPLLSLFQSQTNLRTYRLPTAQCPWPAIFVSFSKKWLCVASTGF